MHSISKSLGLLLVLVAAANAATLRQQRDVSHLPLEYLSPVVLPPLPSHEYLPPVEQHAASLPHVLQPPRDYLPPVEQLKLSNEYLPPATTEAATEEPTTEALEVPTTTTEKEPEVEAVTEPQPETETETEAPSDMTHENLENGSGVLHADGYHYSAPEIVPDLTPEAYLLPLDDNAVVAEELPQTDESAALLDDGYHYRAIRRLRF